MAQEANPVPDELPVNVFILKRDPKGALEVARARDLIPKAHVVLGYARTAQLGGGQSERHCSSPQSGRPSRFHHRTGRR